MSGGLIGMRDYDETARLVLMDQPKINMIGLFTKLREVHGDVISPLTTSVLWRRYRGMDGRQPATHDIETGLPLRGRW